MRIEIPQIYWHGNRDRIMSIDFYPNSNILVTCGAEAEDKMWIKLWEIEDSTNPDVPASNMDINMINQNSNINPTLQNPFKSNKNQNPFINDEKDVNPGMMQVDIESPQAKIRPKFLNEISGAHNATVNVVRFSPNGMYLASGGDDSAIVIWVQKSRPVEFGSTLEKVTWSNYKILRGHLSDVYDLCWSPDSKYLISGSVDNSAIIWNMEKAKGIQKFNDHSHFVQGVSWDPRNKYVATQSSDKSVRFYKNAEAKLDIKFFYLNQLKRFSQMNEFGNVGAAKDFAEDKVTNSILQISGNVNNNAKDKDKEKDNIQNKKVNPNVNIYHYYFADETQCPTFVRRHSWSPDGSICLLVAGINKEDNGEIENVVWGMSRKDLSKPVFFIPTLDKSSVCVRFCPIIFQREEASKKDSEMELLDIPYKMVFAIGTLDSIFIYDTQSIMPRYAITNIHYQPITDLAWKGSSMLAISSSDGYITFASFEKEELGFPIEVEKLPEKARKGYEMYLLVDINKNIVPISNVANIVKPKKKITRIEDINNETGSLSNDNSCIIKQVPIQSNANNNQCSSADNSILDKPQGCNMQIDIEKSSNINQTNSNICMNKRRITPTLISK